MKGPVVQMYSNKELERVSGKNSFGIDFSKKHIISQAQNTALHSNNPVIDCWTLTCMYPAFHFDSSVARAESAETSG